MFELFANNKITKTTVFAFLGAVNLVSICIYYGGLPYPARIFEVTDKFISIKAPVSACNDLLTTIQHGRWVPRTPGEDELAEVRLFLNETRQVKFGIPASLQRKDGRCGNVTYESTKTYAFQATCNRYGDTPCCYDNVCVNKTTSECVCNGHDGGEVCSDSRAVVHADFADFEINGGKCVLGDTSTREAACSAMGDVDISFLGDSLVFQLYVATLIAVRGGKINDAFDVNTNQKNRDKCRGQRLYVHPCRTNTPKAATECNDSVVLSHPFVTYKSAPNTTVMDWVKAQGRKFTSDQRPSVVVLCLGLHDHLDFAWINKTLLQPLLDFQARNPWPKLLWMTPSAPGVLKQKKYIQQQRAAVLAFNAQVHEILPRSRIPVFNPFRMTDGVESYDGTHYGHALNKLKAQILINLIEDQQNTNWAWWGS